MLYLLVYDIIDLSYRQIKSIPTVRLLEDHSFV